MRAGPSQEEIRRHNLGALLRYVHVNGATSRAALTASLGLNRSTIGALTADLVAAGLVREDLPRDHGRTGRPSLVVRPEHDRVYAYAFSVEVDRVTAARVGLGGVVLGRLEAARPTGERPAAEVVAPLAEFVRRTEESVGEGTICVGSGVAVSAMVRQADGLVRLGDPASMEQALASGLTGALHDTRKAGQTVAVRNVADLAAMAEHIRGVAVGCNNVVYLHGDGGVGGGIIAGGRPVTGHGGYGGEVGHMVVNPHG